MRSLLIILTVFSLKTARALTERDVVRSVLTHFPLIDESIMKARASEGDVTAAKGAFDHTLNFNTRLWRQRPYNNEYYEAYVEKQTGWGGAKLIAGHRQGAGDFNYYDLKKDTSSAGQVFAGITLPVFRDFSTDEFRTGLEVAKIQREQALEQVRMKKLLYVHKGLSLYYKWVLQSKKLEISQQVLELAELRHKMLERKFKAGDTDRLKVTDNLRQINKRQSELIETEIDLKKIAAELALFVRNDKGEPQEVTVKEDAETTLLSPLTTGGRESGEANPQVKILSYEKRVNDAQYELSQQRRLPGLDFDVKGFQELSDRPGYGQNILQLGIHFDFPLENRKARGNTVSYHYKRKAVEKELLYMQQQLNQQFKFSVTASVNSRKRWEVSNREFENTKKVADGERKKWSLGASDLFVVNLREQDQADVDKRRWAALYEYHQFNLDAGLFGASLPIDLTGL